MMKIPKDKLRILLLGAVIISVLLMYSLRLMQMQIVDGQSYFDQLTRGTSRVQNVKAARGEIVDRYGNPFTFNEVGFDVVFDRALMPEGIDNRGILKTIRMLESFDEEWIDNLPISKTAPYTFTEDEKAVKKLKTLLGIGDYATCADAIHWLSQRYKLDDMSPEETRLAAGVRYEMESKEFSISNPYTFAREVTIETAVYLRQISNDLPGLTIEESPVRSYADPSLLPHVIGRIGAMSSDEVDEYLAKGKGYRRDDLIGKEGIERRYEDQLRGTEGKRRIYLNANREVFDVVEEQPAIPGNTVTLTIDKNLQKIATESLAKQIKYLNENAPEGKGREADAGAVAAIDIKTGEILALVSYPSYDITRFSTDYDQIKDAAGAPLFNRALLGQYTPGSIFKPLMALAGLNEGIVTPETRINCQRIYHFSPTYNPTCLGYHGPLTVKDALRVSCNIYFYDTGKKLGTKAINNYASQIGLGVATGIELGEKLGTQSDPNSPNPGDTLQASIGQMGNAYTPLQLANYTATLARYGERLKLTIINSINTYNFEENIYTHTPEVAYKMEVAKEHFDTVIDGMVQASHIGTAAATFGNYPIKVASKTGTPQTDKLPNSTFIAFAPADDPQIAVAVVIEKGWHGYTGAPVARDIFTAALLPEQSSSGLVEPERLIG